MLLLSGLIGILLYVTAATLVVVRLRRRQEAATTAVFLAVAAAWLLHTVLLQGALFSEAGIHVGVFNTLLLAAWVIVLILLALALTRPVLILGAGIFPLAAFTVAAALLAGDTGPILTPDAPGITIHVIVSIAAYAVLSLATMQALVLAFQHRILHEHQPTAAIQALPPLAVMEQLLMRMILIGFLLLSAALLSGFIHLEDMFSQRLAHKTVLSIIAWFLFGTLLTGHYLAGWRGPTAVRFTLGGMLLLALGYFGSKVVIEIILQP